MPVKIAHPIVIALWYGHAITTWTSRYILQINANRREFTFATAREQINRNR